MAKFRSAGSYYGHTAEARKRQRANLIPGNTGRKRRTQDIRLNCWWKNAELEARQFIYEASVNDRDFKEIEKLKKLKSEKYLDDWWGGLELEDKKQIYEAMMDPLDPEEKTPILKHIQKCLKGELALLNKG